MRLGLWYKLMLLAACLLSTGLTTIAISVVVFRHLAICLINSNIWNYATFRDYLRIVRAVYT